MRELQPRANCDVSDLLADEDGTASVETLLLTAMVSVPLFFVYLRVVGGLQREFAYQVFIFSQAAP